MTKSLRALVTSTALSAALVLAASHTASAQFVDTCQPGIFDAYNGPQNARYQVLVNALLINPVVSTAQLTADFQATVDETTYATLLADARSLAGSIATGRIVITLPDGTVVVDTSKSNNSYANFQAKAINENHNSRIAFHVAQHYQCGYGLESKRSSTTGTLEAYFALRLGPHLNSVGTVRISSIE
jgi:hypothetical protein